MPPQWGGIIFYVILTAVMVWIWQEATQQVTYRTIAYSEFKAYLERGEVLECSVKDTEIVGTIQPRTTPTSSAGQPGVTNRDPSRSYHSCRIESWLRSQTNSALHVTDPSRSNRQPVRSVELLCIPRRARGRSRLSPPA